MTERKAPVCPCCKLKVESLRKSIWSNHPVCRDCFLTWYETGITDAEEIGKRVRVRKGKFNDDELKEIHDKMKSGTNEYIKSQVMKQGLVPVPLKAGMAIAQDQIKLREGGLIVTDEQEKTIEDWHNELCVEWAHCKDIDAFLRRFENAVLERAADAVEEYDGEDGVLGAAILIREELKHKEGKHG